MKLPKDVYVVQGNISGPTVALFAGVHGNERAGIYALQELQKSLQVAKGTVYLVYANPPAIEKNVRMCGKNLNRCFMPDNSGTSYEDKRARQLMKLLDQCDALLDLHMFYDDQNVPFAICEQNSVDIANLFDVDIISTNWDSIEPGATDGYMFNQGKVGICVECGPISKSNEYTDFAIRTVMQFLSYYDMLAEPEMYSTEPKRVIQTLYAVHKTDESFVLQPGFHDFERLTSNTLIARENGKEYYGKSGECIIFPHYKARIGEEAYIIGMEQMY